MATGSSRFASSVRVKYTISHPAKIIGVCPGLVLRQVTLARLRVSGRR